MDKFEMRKFIERLHEVGVKNVQLETGLYFDLNFLLPFLWIEVTFANFHWKGTMPSEKLFSILIIHFIQIVLESNFVP